MTAVDDMKTLRAQDAEARRVAQTEFDRPLALEAGAGTGKTAILTARILSWILGPGWEKAKSALERNPRAKAKDKKPTPDHVAVRTLGRVTAVTFTEAAAAEMTSRVAEGLAKIERGNLPVGLLPEAVPESEAVRKNRARALLGALDRLNIRTIHGFCLRLLSEYPLESGMHPNFAVDAEGTVRDEVVREVLEDGLKKAYHESNPDLLALAERGIGPLEIENALKIVTERSVPEGLFDTEFFDIAEWSVLPVDLDALIERFFKAGGSLFSGVSKRSKGSIQAFESIAKTYNIALSLTIRSLEDAAKLCEAIRPVREDGTLKRLNDWASGVFNKSESDALGGAEPDVQAASAELHAFLEPITLLDPRLLEHARLVLGPLFKKIRRRMRNLGSVTFGELLQNARDLLDGNPSVRKSIRSGLDQLLVDEFQDTDATQCDIVRFIALDGQKTEGAPDDQRAERPGLFIVGDPKQSIYGWRDADLAAYDRFIDLLKSEGGRMKTLSMNFRSVPAVLDEVTRHIEPVMIRRKGLQPKFQTLIPCDLLKDSRGFETNLHAPVEHWVLKGWNLKAKEPTVLKMTDATVLEAKALADDLNTLYHEHGVAWRDIGVLFRSTGDIDVYGDAMREAGIPYAVTRDRSYFKRREVIDASAVVRCILEPNDHLALLTMLRSVAVGVPDAALIGLWAKGFPECASELWGTDPGGIDRIARIVAETKKEMVSGVPGIERVSGWDRNLVRDLESVSALRESFEHDPRTSSSKRCECGF